MRAASTICLREEDDLLGKADAISGSILEQSVSWETPLLTSYSQGVFSTFLE
jgi:hypothetical protein